MKRCLFFGGMLFLSPFLVHAQGTAFSYQGKLNDGGAPATGLYDLRFTVCDALTNGNVVAGPLTNAVTGISNGLFSATLDFGSGVFTGSGRWLQMDVRTNGNGAFTPLSPREPVMPVPYAIMANSASNLLGTLPPEQLPGSVLTNNQNAVNLTGTFTGNGAGLTNLPSSGSGGLVWQNVTGTSQQAQPNTGYLANNDSAPVTITLPSAPSLGDVVRVSGIATGGWRIVQNSNQVVKTVNLPGNTIGAIWTPRETTRQWTSVASSADGTKLVATVDQGQIYTSADSGQTWTAHESSRNWITVASSADGTRLVAADRGPSYGGYGQIYTSIDSGETWTPRDSNRRWTSLASSADGTKLIAGSLEQVYTSTDSGVTWIPRDSNRAWYGVASSADGSKLIGVVQIGLIYASTNSGVTWNSSDYFGSWNCVASSTDGNKIVAGQGNGLPFFSSKISTSTDSGATWTARNNNVDCFTVASSADGSKLIAAGQNQISTSIDSGLTWTSRSSNRSWTSVASSADGSKLVAVVWGGQIYTSAPTTASTTTLGTAGGLQGDQNSAVELQYIGNGQWLPLSHEGVISAY